MNAHTPGPWFTAKGGYSTIYVEAKLRAGVIQEVAACGLTELREQQEANVRLIAAAPDLLEALQMLVEACTDSNDGCHGTLSTSFVANLVESAIAKATGQSA